MDALIPYIHSKHRGIELLFSLRSVSKFAPHINRVFIIGDKPEFINKNVIHYDYKQGEGTKDYHIAKKVEFGCELSDLGANLLFMNDDHFFTREITYNYPYYYRPELKKDVEKVIYNKYQNETAYFLGAVGRETKDFDVHCPIIYNKRKFLQLSHIWSKSKSYLVKSIYGNYHRIKGEPYVDCKIRKWESRALDNECFSIYDSALYNGALQWLAANFPNPSKFEKKVKFEFKVIESFRDSKAKVYRDRNKNFTVDNKRAMELFINGSEYVYFVGFKNGK